MPASAVPAKGPMASMDMNNNFSLCSKCSNCNWDIRPSNLALESKEDISCCKSPGGFAQIGSTQNEWRFIIQSKGINTVRLYDFIFLKNTIYSPV